jgi:hypothetical protein
MVLSKPVTAAPRWRNWQTRRSQKPMSARTFGFDSRSRHQVGNVIPHRREQCGRGPKWPRNGECDRRCQPELRRPCGPSALLRPPLLAYASTDARVPLLGRSAGAPATKSWEGPLDTESLGRPSGRIPAALLWILLRRRPHAGRRVTGSFGSLDCRGLTSRR